jgi:glyoxylase-like metal-dependent hydrolase (beta-lactamase superfamily II)
LNLHTSSGPLKIFTAPGHTPDGIIPIWGPFLFGGDTLLYGDTGRDDLPGGDPVLHYETLIKIKSVASDSNIFLPGHDGRGGRASSWKTQMEINSSLTQDREAFIREAGGYIGPSPKFLKESLFENFK